MKKMVSMFVIVGLMTCLSISQADATRLKLDHHKERHDGVESNEIPKNFPQTLTPHLGKYLTVDGTSIIFTENKREACDFEMEEIVKTTLGTVYYRITYQDLVLIWNASQHQLSLESKDEKINPLKKQIAWYALLRWLSRIADGETISSSALDAGSMILKPE